MTAVPSDATRVWSPLDAGGLAAVAAVPQTGFRVVSARPIAVAYTIRNKSGENAVSKKKEQMSLDLPSPSREGSATSQPTNVGLRVGGAVVGAAVFTPGFVQL
jgi:hypothetical protein